MISLYLPIVKFILALTLEFSKLQLGHLSETGMDEAAVRLDIG